MQNPIIRIIKSGKMKWEGHVAGKPERKRPIKRPKCICGWIILRWILEREDGVVWTGLVWLRIGTGGELL
jgi:hypothetical protein